VRFRRGPEAGPRGRKIRFPASDSAQGAEGEGFEPSIRLTTDNGFRHSARIAQDSLELAVHGGSPQSARQIERFADREKAPGIGRAGRGLGRELGACGID
jgi:hypothetical protein